MSHPPPKPKPTNPNEHAPGVSRTLERGAAHAKEHADRIEQTGPAESPLRKPEGNEEPRTD